MIQIETIGIDAALSKGYFKQNVSRIQIELFKGNLNILFEKAKNAVQKSEHEEHLKNIVSDFLKNTYYKNEYEINISKRKDLVIRQGATVNEPIGVIIEAKNPAYGGEMMAANNINVKALGELILYYFEEREANKNTEIKHLIASNVYEWFVFDENEFDKLFYRNTKLQKLYKTKIEGGKDNPFFYTEAKKVVAELTETIRCTHFNLNDFEPLVRNTSSAGDEQLIDLYKILSPEHLLKKPFANDSNTLNRDFYNELLHILGLEETPEKGKRLISRKAEAHREEGSLIENTIHFVARKISLSGNDMPNDDIYSIALELCITWLNRILFLKLLEGQLIKYHNGNQAYNFLNSETIKDFDELDELFFDVLAKKHEDRSQSVKLKFGNIPYLNSSLFELTEFEMNYLYVSNLKNRFELSVYHGSVLRNKAEYKNTTKINTLQYLFEFLSAYNFSSDTSAKVQEDSKTIINASVLGLIFEKINGYKDGSFFTPGFITMYMSRETIRRAVAQKFKELENNEIDTFDDVRSYCARYFKQEDIQRFNKHIDAVKICDPAVGSGHFLVSALNELIAIKSELNILTDSEGIPLEYDITVDNDELIIVNKRTNRPFEYTLGDDQKSPKHLQQVQVALFWEKQNIIENSLFGVDINPKSVLICRLRLWIELLKNAYYKNTDELETLPNIDINIKCGNSLISRYKLKDDVFESIPNFKTKLNDYRFWVSEYKRTSDRTLKIQLTRNIKSFTNTFRHRDPRVVTVEKKLAKKNEEYLDKFKSNQLFENKNTKEQAKQRAKLEREINGLTEELTDLKNNKLFDNAFEWRYEFPEVLNENGDFIGFDVVLGNPPYIVLPEKTLSTFYNLTKGNNNTYIAFVELGQQLATHAAKNVSMIIPNTWLAGNNFIEVRSYLLANKRINQVIQLPYNIFDVYVDTLILILNSGDNQNIQYYKFLPKDKFNLNFVLKEINISHWIAERNMTIFLDDDILTLLPKYKKNALQLGEIASIQRGTLPPKSTELVGVPTDSSIPWFTGQIYRYETQQDLQLPYVDYNSLKENKDIALFKTPKILGRQLISRQFRLQFNFIDREFAFKKNLYAIYNLDEAKFSYFYLLAILNSRFYSFLIIKMNTSGQRDDFPALSLDDFRHFLIKNIDLKAQAPFIKKAKKILAQKQENPQADTSQPEAEIDKMVYQLYELTDEEIALIESTNQ